MDKQQTAGMIDMLDLKRPLGDLMKHTPLVMLEELTVNAEARLYFAARVENRELVTAEQVGGWGAMLYKCVALELLRRHKGWQVKVWPRNLSDCQYWKEITVKNGRVEPKRRPG